MSMTLEVFQKKRLPDAPGVYFFLGRNKEILYIGKATSLKSRVRSYFDKRLSETRSLLIEKMVGEAKGIDFKETDSVLEALLLEADLIKKFQPRYNSREKDDKSYNCAVVTKEDFPRVLLVRKYDLDRDFPNWMAGDHAPASREMPMRLSATYGPFPQGTSLKEVLKLIRKIFPFRDAKCDPHSGRPCFNRQIGLCPGVCTGEITRSDYAKTIRNIKLLFSGKKKALMGVLKREMKAYAKTQEFEKADRVKRTLFSLQHIQDISLLKKAGAQKHGAGTNERGYRIEAYDIAHLSGTSTVGVMTVVTDGRMDKSGYRKFRIRGGYGVNDPAGLSEILRRRLGHEEWPLPHVIAVDGNLAQKNAAEAVLKERNVHIPVAAVVKDERHRPRQILFERDLSDDERNAVLLANSEAHRFAVAYHRSRRDRIQ